MLKTIKYNDKSMHSSINMEGICKRYNHVCFFTSNEEQNQEQRINYKQLLAIGSSKECVIKEDTTDFKSLEQLIAIPEQWKFGYLTYDLKNSIEELSSKNDDKLNFSLFHFFIPEYVIEFENDYILVHYDDKHIFEKNIQEIINILFSESSKTSIKKEISSKIKCKISKEEYLKQFKKLKNHIQQGDIYEINYCFEFFSENEELLPYEVFKNLNKISCAPFASFCKFYEHYVISSSPERFIKKTGKTLISQPIKGTKKREKNKADDENAKYNLKNNLKDKTENVMIVDLVRNDLSKIAEHTSVKADELFGVYTFKQVHQMISTVSCKLKENISFIEIIKALFPMGSMTGAPKISAMKLIEETEKTKRGLYSGSIGYIHPNGDFDFNVVIRSILYNSKNMYSSVMVGSAITNMSDAESEYEECLLKAKAMLEVIEKTDVLE